MKECMCFICGMIVFIIGMAIGQWGISSQHEYLIGQGLLYYELEQVRHYNEEERLQLAYKLQCQSQIADAIYQIDSQTKGKWKIKLKPWIVL
jgi:hypothetical protein